MHKLQTRRRVLTTLAGAGLGATLLPRWGMAAEGSLETTTVRLPSFPIICFAPQYVCEEMLRAEGFTDVRYVEADPLNYSQEIGRGKYDFGAQVTAAHIAAIDAGAAITLLSGVHAGCYELFAHDESRGIAGLKGKTVGCSATPDLIQMVAGYVGLDPRRDIKIVIDTEGKALQQFVAGEIDAYMGLPPEPQELHARGFRHPIVRTAVDPPWSQYFCCALAANRAFVASNPVATK